MQNCRIAEILECKKTKKNEKETIKNRKKQKEIERLRKKEKVTERKRKKIVKKQESTGRLQ